MARAIIIDLAGTDAVCTIFPFFAESNRSIRVRQTKKALFSYFASKTEHFANCSKTHIDQTFDLSHRLLCEYQQNRFEK